MLKLLKKYCVEICLLLIVFIIILRTSNILEKFREPDATEKDALAERLRYMEAAGVINI